MTPPALSRADIEAEENALMDFQFAVIDEMNRRKMSKVDLAERLAIPQADIDEMFSSEGNPPIKLVGRVLHALGLHARIMNPAAD